MLPLALDELMHLTRDELCRLAEGLERQLPCMGAGTVSRYRVLISLENIRRMMIMRRLSN